jgi:hypothetical protein
LARTAEPGTPACAPVLASGGQGSCLDLRGR